MQMCDSSWNSSAKYFQSSLLEDASLLHTQRVPLSQETASLALLGVSLAHSCLPLRFSEKIEAFLVQREAPCEKQSALWEDQCFLDNAKLFGRPFRLTFPPPSRICPWLCLCIIKDILKCFSQKQRSNFSSKMNSGLTLKVVSLLFVVRVFKNMELSFSGQRTLHKEPAWG